MFILVGNPLEFRNSYAEIFQTEIQDLVQIAPEDFQKSSIEAIEDNLNAKYSNKVYIAFILCGCNILKYSMCRWYKASASVYVSTTFSKHLTVLSVTERGSSTSMVRSLGREPVA